MEWCFQLSSLKPVLTNVQEVDSALGKLKDMGFNTLQIQWIDPCVPDECVRDLLTKHGLRCVALQDKTTAVEATLSRMLGQINMWGAEYLTISGIPADMSDTDGIKKYAARLSEINTECKSAGAAVTFHPLQTDYRLVDGMPAAFMLMDILGGNIGLTPDLYHINKAGIGCRAVLERFAGLCDMVHFKSRRVMQDGTEKLVPMGEGDEDWIDEAATCRETGVKYAFVEQEKWEGDPFPLMEKSLRYAEKL